MSAAATAASPWLPITADEDVAGGEWCRRDERDHEDGGAGENRRRAIRAETGRAAEAVQRAQRLALAHGRDCA